MEVESWLVISLCFRTHETRGRSQWMLGSEKESFLGTGHCLRKPAIPGLLAIWRQGDARDGESPRLVLVFSCTQPLFRPMNYGAGGNIGHGDMVYFLACGRGAANGAAGN